MQKMAGFTHPGRRKHNEDAFAAEPSIGLALVADGMGGYASGEVASALVRDTLVADCKRDAELVDAVLHAHRAIKQAVTEGIGGHGMGSTLVAARCSGANYEIAWVGDSRAYLWTGEELHQLSRDHSYVESLLASGAIDIQQAADHPNKNLITQALGVPDLDAPEVGLLRGVLGCGQLLLLCSDGVNDELSDLEIARALSVEQSLEDKAQSLVDAAVAAGGRDNATAVLIAGDDASEGWSPQAVQITRLSGEAFRPEAQRPPGLPTRLQDDQVQVRQSPNLTDPVVVSTPDKVGIAWSGWLFLLLVVAFIAWLL